MSELDMNNDQPVNLWDRVSFLEARVARLEEQLDRPAEPDEKTSGVGMIVSNLGCVLMLAIICATFIMCIMINKGIIT